MVVRVSWQRWLPVVLGVVLTGCSGEGGTPSPETTAAATANGGPSEVKASSAANVDAHWRQPFEEAAIDASQGAPPPEGVERPPDETLTKKPTVRLLEQMKKNWDTIPLVDEQGQPLVYPVLLETKLGTIHLQLHAAWAPNHVRNFIALARAGYYDGLVFDRMVHQTAPRELSPDGNPLPDVDLIEGGCPIGTGEPGYGSIGYWLKPEFNPELKHEEGIVGACRLEAENTAACRFYISLCKAPVLDGFYTVFGKVDDGLDVARKIWREPRIEAEQDGGYHRPLDPVVIRKVTIEPPRVDKSGPIRENKN